MEKKIDGHIVGFGYLYHWDLYENYTFYDEIKQNDYNVYDDIPSRDELDQICKELSSEVCTYKLK